MKSIKIEGIFTYDDYLMYGQGLVDVQKEDKQWFIDILTQELLPVFSDAIGDELGKLQVTKFEEI